MDILTHLILGVYFYILTKLASVASVVVYRNPDFFAELQNDYDDHLRQYKDEPTYQKEDIINDEEDYKYPGEPKRPNPSGGSFDVNYDSSPEFTPPGRDIYLSNSPPKRHRGPYGHQKNHLIHNPYEQPNNYNAHLESNDYDKYHASPEYSSYEHGTSDFEKDYDDTYEKEKNIQENRRPSEFEYSVKTPSKEEIIPDDKKVGTREYQKLQSLKKKSKPPPPPPSTRYACETIIRKLPNSSYRIRPKTSNYRVVPVVPYWNKLVPYKNTVDHGAYSLNSDLDLDYQQIKAKSQLPYRRYVEPSRLQGFLVSVHG